MTLQEAQDQAALEFGYHTFEQASNETNYSQEIRINNTAMEIFAEAKAKEAYNQGVRDWEAANEKANKILDGLREKSKYVEAYNQGVMDAAESAEGIYDEDNATWTGSVSKQSILKLLK